MAKILIVEDEEKIARFLELELLHEGHEVEKCGDGREGLERAETGAFDLVLLDIMLPELNGLEVLRRLRRNSQLPVILLTARDSVMDKVSGLDMGADDYITKPFSIEELLARIRNVLRKKQDVEKKLLSYPPLELDLQRHSLRVKGQPVELTGREFDLLRYFLENAETVLDRETILNKVWGYDFLGETNVVDVYVRYLRHKIDDSFSVKLLHTVRGIGYCLRSDDPA